MAYLSPTKILSQFLPKLLSPLSNPSISHQYVLRYIKQLICPLIYSEEFSKRFYFLRFIWDECIAQFSAYHYEANLNAFTIINRILNYIPVLNLGIFSNMYRKTNPGESFEDYVNGIYIYIYI